MLLRSRGDGATYFREIDRQAHKTDGFVLGEGPDDGLLVAVGLRLDTSLLE